jgi:dolichyl-phosphate-mannose--protein O-mannosyl transferase
MVAVAKTQSPTIPWFGPGLVAIWLFSLALRFWGLSRFNTLVFDEIYYARFAADYLQGIQEFGGHPPLSTYLIAGGMWLGQHLPFAPDTPQNGLSGLQLTPFSYRWLNAFTGSLIPPVVGAIALQLTHRRRYALLAAGLAALDGLFLVESRYALNNIYLVLFGLVGQWLLLLAMNRATAPHPSAPHHWVYVPRWQTSTLLALAGASLGAAAAIKWNGLWFLFGTYLLWGIVWGMGQLRPWRPILALYLGSLSPVTRLSKISPAQFLTWFGLVPAWVYYLSWIPYMRLSPEVNFWQWQLRILDYHSRVGDNDTHPYCSSWYSWFVMWRPVGYFYKTSHAVGSPPPIVGPPLPANAAEAVYDVHAIGNPILWWAATAAIALLAIMVIYLFIQGIAAKTTANRPADNHPPTGLLSWTALYLVINWVANWLPWMRVGRCTFLYHYMGASMFAILAIALLMDRWLDSPRAWHRITAMAVILTIVAAFFYWLPIYLGLPLDPVAFRLRQWFPSWI